MQQRPPHSRRRFLRALGTTLAVAPLAGCPETSERMAPGTTGASGDPTDTEVRGGTTGDHDPSTTPDGEGTATPTPIHASYETTDVTVRTPDGEVLGRVTAAIADTPDLRYLGLSDTEFLPEDRGMLFVYDEVGDHTYVMREMDFGLDIVYADDEGAVTTIHHARAPGPDEDGNDLRFPGRGQYVLEVNRGWTTERGVEEGDVLDFEL